MTIGRIYADKMLIARIKHEGVIETEYYRYYLVDGEPRRLSYMNGHIDKLIPRDQKMFEVYEAKLYHQDIKKDTFAANLRRVMAAAGVDRKELMKKSGIRERDRMAKYIKGCVQPRPNVIERIANALNVSASELTRED